MGIKLSDILTLDFETFYSTEYSLTKKNYNTSSYIRDPQFKVHCIGVKDGTKKTVWFPGEDTAKVLKQYGAKSRPVMAHNMPFDGFIMSDRYGVVAPYYLCTLSMARALHGTLSRNDLDTVSRMYGRGGKVAPANLKKVKGLRDLPPELLEGLAEYMCGDVDECYAIGKVQLKVFPQKELDVIDWTVRQFCDPVLQINPKLVQEELDDEVSGKASKRRVVAAMKSIDGLIKKSVDSDKSVDDRIKDMLQSAEQFASALECLGVDPPVKLNKDGELTYAFAKNDLAFQDLLEHEDERVVALVEARLATKSTIGETRARRMLELTGRPVPVAYNYCGAHTTRWSGGNKLNFQNFQRQAYFEDKSPDLSTGRLRRSIIAPDGYVLVVCDSAQIEARVLAWLADQLDILEAFANGEDVYKKMAAQIYNVDISTVTKDQRFIGKIAVLGLGYGMGWKKFRATLAMGTMGPAVFIDENEARRIVNMYRRSADMVVALWEKAEKILGEMICRREGTYKCLEWDEQSVWLPNGLGLHYYALNGQYDPDREKFTDIQYRERGRYRKIYGGLFTENLVQALARVIIAEQLLVVNQKYRAVMTTHDEIVALARTSHADKCLNFMYKTMSTPPEWAPTLPLSCEGGYDICYSK
jgi:hypothetical protein